MKEGLYAVDACTAYDLGGKHRQTSFAIVKLIWGFPRSVLTLVRNDKNTQVGEWRAIEHCCQLAEKGSLIISDIFTEAGMPHNFGRGEEHVCAIKETLELQQRKLILIRCALSLEERKLHNYAHKVARLAVGNRPNRIKVRLRK